MEVSVGKIVAFCIILGILFKVYVYSPFEFMQNNAVIDIENTKNEVSSMNIFKSLSFLKIILYLQLHSISTNMKTPYFRI